mgnify:CR=1 FL=1
MQARPPRRVDQEGVAEGIERRMIWGEHLMVCKVRFAPNLVTPMHSHPHEQITIVERGKVRFLIGGEAMVASPGDVVHFPPGIEHSATMLDEEVDLVDIFTPVRDDFVRKASSETER